MANAGEDAQKQPLEVLFKKEQVAGSGLQLYLKRDSGTGACNFIKKETLAQVFSCEFCEIYKNTFFYRIPLVAAFECQKVIAS